MNDTYPFGLKDGYVMMLDDVTGNFYYANKETGDTTWERPERDGIAFEERMKRIRRLTANRRPSASEKK